MLVPCSIFVQDYSYLAQGDLPQFWRSLFTSVTKDALHALLTHGITAELSLEAGTDNRSILHHVHGDDAACSRETSAPRRAIRITVRECRLINMVKGETSPEVSLLGRVRPEVASL